MIIMCPNCMKKFQLDPSLLPVDGRELQCGSCKNVWFYKAENKTSTPLTLKENLINNEEYEDNFVKEDIKNINEDKKTIIEEKSKIKDKDDKIVSDKAKTKTEKGSTGTKFFSYLIVLIISFVAVVILVDTLKTPIINVFPRAEIILFNLFETLKDIKLFIIDLS